jgi:hypothetical protein
VLTPPSGVTDDDGLLDLDDTMALQLKYADWIELRGQITGASVAKELINLPL